MKISVRTGRAAAGLLGLAAAALAFGATTHAASTGGQAIAAGHKCPVATGSGDSVFTRNFNPYNAPLDFTLGAIYEPLVITTPMGGGHQYLWLASKLAWSKDGKTLTITVRPGVKWSDGKPLTADDVVYSLTAGRQDPSMDKIGLTTDNSEIASISKVGRDKVAIHLKQVDSTFVGSTLNAQFVVPKHVFSKVADIKKFTNTRPVGSGPFTTIARFTGQDYVLGKNPHYWQAGAPRVACFERIAATSNDAALLQIVNSDADWTHNFVPNVEKAYVSHDPAHYHAFYSTTALPIGLFFDITKYPYSLVGFRKGLSQAIDRAKVSKLGEYGYAPPTDALGIGYMWPGWVDKSLLPQAKKLATYDPTAARKTLTDAGFSYKGGKLLDPEGSAVSFDIHVISGWSDWVASLQIIAKNLQEIGIDANVKLEPDWGAWQPGAMSTKFVTLLWNYGSGPTPYGYFKQHFDVSSNLGTGVESSATGNWEHFSDPAATQLLAAFRGTLDEKKQHQIANKLQALFLQKYPYVPLFIGPRWSTYSTKYFAGWPTPKNAYADPIFTTFPDVTKILTSVRPA